MSRLAEVTGNVSEAGECLSSKWTLLSKYLVPIVLVLLFGSIVPALLLRDWFRDPSKVPVLLLVGTPVGIWTITYLYIRFIALKLRQVYLRQDTLILSGFRSEVRVPLASVRRVTVSHRLNAPLVLLEFRTPTPCGQIVLFIPAQKVPGGGWLYAADPKPVITMLRNRVAKAGGVLERD